MAGRTSCGLKTGLVVSYLTWTEGWFGCVIPHVDCRLVWLCHTSCGLKAGLVVSYLMWTVGWFGCVIPHVDCRLVWLCHTSCGLKAGLVVSYLMWTEGWFGCHCSSTDSQLKLWNVNKPHCLRTFRGHSNEKNFVGLATDGDYVACGMYLPPHMLLV